MYITAENLDRQPYKQGARCNGGQDNCCALHEGGVAACSHTASAGTSTVARKYKQATSRAFKRRGHAQELTSLLTSSQEHFERFLASQHFF